MRISAILASCALAAILLQAQAPKGGTSSGGPSTGGPPAGSPGTGANPSVNPPSMPGNTTSNSTTTPGIGSRGEYFFGKVVMPDGTAPPIGVVIEARLQRLAAPRRRIPIPTVTSSFQVGQTQDMLPDASVDNSGSHQRLDTGGASQQGAQRGSTSMYACDLRANLAGYRSDLISLAGRRNLDDPNVGTIKLHSMANYEGLTTSATAALAPKEAHKAFEKGLEAMKKSKIDEAQEDFLKATEIYPRYASAWYELGLVYEKGQRIPEAREAYKKSIAADSKYVNPYERLYMLAFDEKKWVEVAQITNQVMHLNPYDFPESLYFNAVANSQLKRLDIAEKSAREAIQLSATQNPKVYYILGVILVKKQDYKGASENLRIYLKSNAVTDRDQVTKLLADCERSRCRRGRK